MYNDMNYSVWRERMVIQDCLNDLGLDRLAKNAMSADSKTMRKYLSIIKTIAEKRNKESVLERLYFADLVYG
jgi:hypothetical protein